MSAKDIDKHKRKALAPCGYYNDGSLEFPAVNCAMKCDSCGWNPKEAKRRMATGTMQTATVRLNLETGLPVKMTGVRQLVFKRPV